MIVNYFEFPWHAVVRQSDFRVWRQHGRLDVVQRLVRIILISLFMLVIASKGPELDIT